MSRHSTMLDDDNPVYTFVELVQCSRLDEGFVIQCVEYGIAEAEGSGRQDWLFQAEALLKLQRAWRLHRDLEVQVSSLVLVLDLLDEVEELRRECELLRQRLQHWEA
jgi:chaperone modulatory protein CbpM